MQNPTLLPHWITTVSGWAACFATVVIVVSIFMHLINYRKPFQQRLMIRIQLIIPLFALSCYSMLVNPTGVVNKYVIEPTREIYEAFVIYTFFSLLIDMLGGAKSIVIMTSGRPPVPHPGIMHYCLPDLDISDPHTFLAIKRGILQYVWLKPVLCFGTLFAESVGWYNVNDMGVRSLYLWFTIVYNLSVSLSLYCLAIFWKILWNDLKPFNPIGKFLCVKLIIFASYWQGVMLAILNVAGVLPQNSSSGETESSNIGMSIQNALLCVELIAFAVGHWFSFSYKPFTIANIPNGRLQLYYAFRDMIGFKDLLIDFRLTFHGDYYRDYKQFDSVDATIAHPSSNGRMSRINQGLRYHTDGKQKHWISQQHGIHQPQSAYNAVANKTVQSTSEIYAIPGYGKPRSNSQYTASVHSNGTTRGIYPESMKGALSPPGSPRIGESGSGSTSLSQEEGESESIEEILKNLIPEISYHNEDLDEDERLYMAAASVVNNYNLDQTEVKKLVNYPIVDEMIGGHEYGYKVKKLRADRLRQQALLENGKRTRTGKRVDYGSV